MSPAYGAGLRRQPPQFESTVKFSKRFRFSCAAILAQDPVTANDLLALLVVADTTLSAKSILGAVKLNSIEIWAPPAASVSTPNSIAVEWVPTAAIGGPAKIISDTTLGTAAAAYVFARPPLTSVAGQWLAVSTQPIMFLSMPEGTIVDVDLTMTLASGQPVYTTPITGGTYVVGDLFMNALDLYGAGVLLPVSYAVA
jgi:hypothetical protein